ncbi:MAG: thiol:disulfide interchange protein DsbA/DsbL [Legionella sp.]|nr:thiol:disulfide interchange protein DsbA/DsbL [Legionella sp.]
MLKRLLYILLLLPSLVMASPPFVEGKEYQLISNPEPLDRSLKGPLITEFFSYACPWCYKIETQFNQWHSQVGQSLTVNKVPVVFHPEWILYAKAYYCAKILALSDKMDPLLFQAIQDKKQKLNTPQDMIDFFVAQGVDKEIAKSAFTNSSTIDTYVNNGMALMARYQVNAVPSFVINNKYKTDIKMAGTPERLFEVLNYLIRKPA